MSFVANISPKTKMDLYLNTNTFFAHKINKLYKFPTFFLAKEYEKI